MVHQEVSRAELASSDRNYLEEPVAPAPGLLLLGLKARQAEMIRQALRYRAEVGDPVQTLADVLAGLSGDDDRWQEIIGEPYG